jgi:ADP-ribose pyrophosphatase YjhB (NUDIX family)
MYRNSDAVAKSNVHSRPKSGEDKALEGARRRRIVLRRVGLGPRSVLQSKGSMSRHYPTHPIVGVAGIVLDGDRVLLVKRGREPLKGIWSLPGGGLELGETLREGVQRELREEVGLNVRVLEMVEVLERITPGEQGRTAYHYVLIDFLCESDGGVPRADDDVDEVAWVDRGRIGEYETTEGAPAVIEKAFVLRDARVRR